LQALPAEVDLDPRVGPVALDVDDHAFAEAGVGNALPDPPRDAPVETKRRALLGLRQPAAIAQGAAVALGAPLAAAVAPAAPAARALEALPGASPTLAARTEAARVRPGARGEPLQRFGRQLLEEPRAQVVAGLAI